MRNGLGVRASSCAVCGSREVGTDAVEHGGWLLLARVPALRPPLDAAPRRAACARARRVRAAVQAVRPEVANAA